MYTISLDAAKIFECSLKVKGVNIKNTKVNLVIESSDIDFRCRGKIDENGKVNIPIKKLKGILDENVSGNMYLEVIADENYFIPFKSEYITEVSKKINIEESVVIKDAEAPVQIVESSIQTTLTTSNPLHSHAIKIIKNMSDQKINIFKSEHKQQVVECIRSYISKNNIKETEYDNIIKEILNQLSSLI